jgi:hypothetical protein
MAAIAGDLSPSDEGMHEIEADSQFNESMLITYFDEAGDSGGLLRIGNRPNEGYAEVTFCLFPPGGGALFQFARAPISSNDEFAAGGMRFTIGEPTDTLHISYEGEAAFFDDARALADPGPAFRAAPRRAVRLELDATSVSPMYGARSGTSVGGHYEQHMAMTGTVSLDGAVQAVSGRGNRDHSWGPRNWHRTFSDRTLWCTFGPEFGFAVSLTWSDADTDPEVMGTVTLGDQARPLVAGTITSEFEDNGLYHTSFRCQVTDDQGDTYDLDGLVRRFIPFRHRRDGHITHIGQGMTQFRCNGKSAYGLSEYMDLVQ